MSPDRRCDIAKGVPQARFPEAGHILSRLAKSQGLSSKQLAHRLSIPAATVRGYLAGLSAPRANDVVNQRLAAQFGEDGVAYLKAVADLRRPKSDTRHDAGYLIDHLLTRGRLLEAHQMLDEAVGNASDLAAQYMTLGRGYFDRSRVADGIDCYLKAASLYGERDEIVRYLDVGDELASRLTLLEEYDRATMLVVTELKSRPESYLLWRRLGVNYWYADRLVDSYAALSTALQLGCPRPRVAHVRGQVLAELGQYQAAIDELDLALAAPLTPHSASYALSARAYARFFLGQRSEAFSDFINAECEAPNNAWLHWYRARCHDEMGDHANAERGYKHSLDVETPALNKSKREFALRRMIRYNETSE